MQPKLEGFVIYGLHFIELMINLNKYGDDHFGNYSLYAWSIEGSLSS